jgi:hypothetical protein
MERRMAEPDPRNGAHTLQGGSSMKNEGTADRVIRVVIGLALLSLTVIGPHTPWGYVGLVPLATGVFGFCPLYRLVGVNTCGLPKS